VEPRLRRNRGKGNRKRFQSAVGATRGSSSFEYIFGSRQSAAPTALGFCWDAFPTDCHLERSRRECDGVVEKPVLRSSRRNPENICATMQRQGVFKTPLRLLRVFDRWHGENASNRHGCASIPGIPSAYTSGQAFRRALGRFASSCLLKMTNANGLQLPNPDPDHPVTAITRFSMILLIVFGNIV
jgi:hypothetical protein